MTNEIKALNKLATSAKKAGIKLDDKYLNRCKEMQKELNQWETTEDVLFAIVLSVAVAASVLLIGLIVYHFMVVVN